ncbi:serine/threonine-protein kinase [Nocardia suismassiliense]|uniref:serine/threonine-protein kinase n=1 Tax=Nocardia suismassiliense TaxID=2077092 RepID=UPI000D1DD19E|nr:serine/threonine-protein kinase [Nocardia suismassiliense]
MGETWFGHYRLDRLLGSGGTGQVWLAHDSSADRVVALKVLSASVAADPKYRQRFTREARLAAQVRGPHLAAIHSFGELDGQLYLDMEYIEGTDLATVLRCEGPMAPARAVRIVVQVAEALDAAHRAGMVHRDVKPSNIMLDAAGVAHLIDFGTAYRVDQPAITTSSNVVGTLAYMAPERFSGAGDARSDQYSLACVLYECLTARRPFGNADAAQSLMAHLMTDPPLAADFNHAVPAGLDAVIARGMAKVPEQRCASAGELASAAYAAITGLDVPTVQTSAAAFSTSALPEPIRAADVPATLPLSRASGQRDSARAGMGAGAAAQGVPWSGRFGGSVGDGGVRAGIVAGEGVSRQRAAAESLRGDAAGRSAGSAGHGPGSQEDGSRQTMRSRVAAGALVVLLVAVGMALWLGRPGGPGKDSAAPTSVPTATAGPSATAPAQTLPPAAANSPAPVPAPSVTVPVAWQPCDPTVDVPGLAKDGTLLHCVGTADRAANWMPAMPAAEKPKQDTPKPKQDTAKPGHGDESSGNSGNGNGNGRGKPGNGR